MGEHDELAQQFEQNRPHLRAVAYRMLGSMSEADDAVQDAWFRLSRADVDDVDNLAGWLTTVVARICLDTLRARKSRPETPIEEQHPGQLPAQPASTDPEHLAVLADSVGPALLLVLDTLEPDERLAFVLHDIFDMPFNDIALIVDRSPAATRQLASRSRRRVREADVPYSPDLDRQRDVVEAFLAASREGDFAGLLAVLHPDMVYRADAGAVRLGGLPVVCGAEEFAKHFSGTAQAARPVVVNGVVGATWAPGNKPKVVLDITIANGKIIAIDAIANPGHLDQLNLVFLDS